MLAVMNCLVKCDSAHRQCMLVQEEEERFRPGTNKAVSLQVLKDAGHQGMSLGNIMEVSQARGLKEWEPGAKRILQFVSISNCVTHPVLARHLLAITLPPHLSSQHVYRCVGHTVRGKIGLWTASCQCILLDAAKGRQRASDRCCPCRHCPMMLPL